MALGAVGAGHQEEGECNKEVSIECHFSLEAWSQKIWRGAHTHQAQCDAIIVSSAEHALYTD